MNRLSTANYKGTRDFYPEDMKIRNWMFSVMKSVVQRFGYQEYDGPLLEYFELYKAKSGEEIERQLYSFYDKGDRHVAIRPEMTPTLARMVAARIRELPRPIRWFSIPNLWRYEAPGHGRLREHWQLNVDLFGTTHWSAELEIIQIACEILFAFGASPLDFRVTFSSRKILNQFLKNSLSLNEKSEHDVAKLLDKKNKISKEEFESQVVPLLPNKEKDLDLLYKFLNSDVNNITDIQGITQDVLEEIQIFHEGIKKLGLEKTVFFDPSIIRGFDYYTGFIFEIFDTNPINKRSLYGGGRYDNLVGLFSSEQISGIGFGLGDVTLLNFLQTHNLVPSFGAQKGVFLGFLGESSYFSAIQLASEIRKSGILCETNLEPNLKFGKLIQQAEKKNYRYMLILGENELESNQVLLKDLSNGNQEFISRSQILDYLKSLEF